MSNSSSSGKGSVLYIPHGGGPLPLLADNNHKVLVEFLKTVSSTLDKPDAVVIISAHWEEKQPTILSGAHPPLFYDYYGFPSEAYNIQYPAPGFPALADEIQDTLSSAGFPIAMDSKRGFDHGMFVPMKLMYPAADIPCVQISLLSSLDPQNHIALGKALSFLLRRNILIIGSGFSFHNLRAFFSDGGDLNAANDEFQDWLIDSCTNPKIDNEEKEDRLIHWSAASHARLIHPREEHLLPLHVCFGMAKSVGFQPEIMFNKPILGKRTISILWR